MTPSRTVTLFLTWFAFLRKHVVYILLVNLIAKSGDHRSNRSEYNNPYTILLWIHRKKTETTASIHHFQRFPKSRILVHNSNVLEKLKPKREMKVANAKRYSLQSNTNLHFRNLPLTKTTVAPKPFRCFSVLIIDLYT